MSDQYNLVITPKTRFLNFFRRFLIFSHLDKVLAQFTKGKDPESFVSRIIPPNYLYSSTLRKKNYNGINFILDIKDTMDHGIYFGFRDKAQSALFDLIKPGSTIVDVGVNMGFTALNFAKLAGEAGKVIGFEPDPVNFKRALVNINANEFSNITVHNIGLGSEAGEMFLYNVNESNRGMLRVLKEDSGNFEKIPISIVTLDSFFNANPQEAVDLIKIDVEGYERKVLEGSIHTLERYRPKLFIELDDRNLQEHGSSARDLVQFLKLHSYRVVFAATQEEIDNQTDLSNCHTDIFCYSIDEKEKD